MTSAAPLTLTILILIAVVAVIAAIGTARAVGKSAPSGAGQNPGVRVPQPNAGVRKLDENTTVLPYADVAQKSPEEVQKELGDKTGEELVKAARDLSNSRLYSAAAVVYKNVVDREDVSLDARLEALGGYAAAMAPMQKYEELEADLEAILKAYPDDWRMMTKVVSAMEYLPQEGVVVAGEFTHDYSQGTEVYSCAERRRVRKLQILRDALPLVRAELKEESSAAKSAVVTVNQFFSLFYNNLQRPYWQRQTLTDVDELPDYEPQNYAWYRGRNQGAPVDEEGNPIFYKTPESFEAAQNDGERLQALRAEEFELIQDPYRRAQILRDRAQEAKMLFGVETLASYRFFFDDKDREAADAGIWALETLQDSETIAKLANGVKRFTLPEDYDYIALLKEALEFSYNPYDQMQIAQEYESRRQLDKAADVWRDIIRRQREKGASTGIIDQAEKAISQIVDPRVSFDAAASQVSGTDVKLVLRNRNATAASVVVRKLNIDALFNQLKDDDFLKSRRLSLSIQGRLLELVEADAIGEPVLDHEVDRIKELKPPKGKFVGGEVANFETPLTPDPRHYDVLAPVELPKLAPGAYLIECVAKGGPKDSREAIVVWLADMAVARRSVSGGQRYFVMNAETGEPRANTPVEFTTVIRRRETVNAKGRQIDVERQTSKTDEQGSLLVNRQDDDPVIKQTVTLVKAPIPGTNDFSYAFLDFNSAFWRVERPYDSLLGVRAFFVSDRPIYRPKQTANFKFWIGNPRYDAPEAGNEWAGKTVAIQISSPTGETIVRKSDLTLDKYGAISDSFEIPADAKLGVYSVAIGDKFAANGYLEQYYGSGGFRLEEYRKPEYKVSIDAPKDPVALGDKFKATVRADYYFGAPVAGAKVTYKVTRQQYQSTWYPARYWDWFYGCGYWKFPYDAEWYPGWSKWGCRCVCGISPGYYNPGIPEVVVDGEGELDENGELEIEIDSSLAKVIYPSDDQTYEIEAEVVDESRRVISGRGKVYVAREPFTTTVWLDRGFYKTGQKMTTSFKARRLDGKPVVGNAVVKLYRVTYEPTDDGTIKPIETEVFAQELKTDEEGAGTVETLAAKPGQYRVSAVVTTEEGIAEEGGQLVMISGVAAKDEEKPEFHFNALEIIPDKPEYAPGETVRLQIASNRPDARVVLFLRPEGGWVEDKPIYLNLENGVAYYDVKVEKGDQPNFFVDAFTVFDGRMVQEKKEIVVPPQKRVLDVAITPEKERVKPGEKAKLKLRLTDPDGKPVVGQTVVTVYDQSLEAISGGSNVGDIREFFWKWRRYASANYMTSLGGRSYFDVTYLRFRNADASDRMRPIGAFGGLAMTNGFAGSKSSTALRKNRNRAFNAPVGAMAGGMGGGMAMAATADMAFDDMEVAEEAVADADAAPMMARMEAKALAAPAAAPMMKEEAASFENGAEAESSDEASFAEPQIRKNLADLAYWVADLVPNDDGVVDVEIDMPDNLTTWKIAAWSVGDGLRVGSGESTVVTTKDLILRMEKPRFLTRGDEAVLSAIVHNYGDEEKKVKVGLEFPEAGETPAIVLDDGAPSVADVVVAPNDRQRVEWTVRAVATGEVTLLMKALAEGESDAIQDTITINEHGIDRQIPFSGLVPPRKSDPDNVKRETNFTFKIPAERREDSSQLIVRFSPTLAGAILDAIPYLTEYPYGCTEQTLNRFLPAVVAQRALIDLGVDLESIAKKRANLNAQEIGDPSERAAQWRNRGTRKDPIFDTAETRNLVAAGVEKLQSMQNGDGGWGWFSGAGEVSSPRLTALITRGLKIAQDCDQEVDVNAIARGIQWLTNYERQQGLRVVRGMVWTDEQKRNASWQEWKERADDEDAFVYYALTELGVTPAEFQKTDVDYDKADYGEGVAADAARVHAVMKELLWDAKNNLEIYTLATYGLALEKEPSLDDSALARLETIFRIIMERRVVDDENQTVWLDLNRGGWRWWSWFGSEFETQAYYLRALQGAPDALLKKLGLQTDAPRLVKYLLNNRKHATYWNSTRDTAVCVEAFAEYLTKTDELKANQKVVVTFDGKPLANVEYTPETLFDIDGTVEVPLEALDTGEHTVGWTVEGEGPLYCNAYFEYFTLEDPIEKSGLEVKAERNVYKLTLKKDATTTVEGGRGQAVSQRVEQYDKELVKSGDEIKSGDLVEIELIVDSKNDYESIMIRDFKAAGMEPVDVRSGYRYFEGLSSYVEFRDAFVCFFVSNLPQGRSVITYRLRAETPGTFSALPTTIEGMYAPELKGNSDEFKAKIAD